MHKRMILTCALTSALSPAFAQPAPLSPPAPPAGITWRNQAATPAIAPRAPVRVIAPEEDGPRVRRFVIRRERLDDASAHHSDEHHSSEPEGDEFGMGEFEAEPDHDEPAIGDDLRADFQDYADQHDGSGMWRDDGYAAEPSAVGYAQAQCCSGGMITETITTTTTYPPTVHERVSVEHVAEHRPVRIGKRKLRRR